MDWEEQYNQWIFARQVRDNLRLQALETQALMELSNRRLSDVKGHISGIAEIRVKIGHRLLVKN